ncbi:trimeric intracellular cation channel family protein [Pontibacter silvestris]|uniref:Trimeric intracellular cation channel family protein n=1 Tax=Pontibacter silvestris TaxID=2305183 RepID=A0ABW4X2M9_9BACT|nr:trimeric intracellular cation channel family protein [Pontibacter silvestris]MCC9138990.1 trimeric intracellular cation channel family protein [Pontibacter silvestris]
MVYYSALSFTTALDLLGTFAFAVSGIRWASTKKFDWFGAYAIGLVTAIGGGTTRDLLLNATPFWMQDASYLVITGAALLATLLFRNRLFRWGRALFLFDSIGLGLFTVVGVGKSLAAGFPFWVCIPMGAITGSVGGVLRDVLLNEVPLLFRKDIYALACIAGGNVYMVCYRSGLPASLTELLAALTVMAIRVVAVRYHVQLPFLKPMDAEHEDKGNKE